MLGSGRFLYKQVDSIPKVFNSTPKVRHCSGEIEKKIIIPPRIERGPTDILKALASTVGLDPTAFHYKYPDDPFFYPYSQTEKRVYALSIESGRKSAKWVIKENPGFFKHQLADPPIEAFLQKLDSISEAEVTEESLLSAIGERNILAAIKTYEDLKANNQDVKSSTKQSLLELVCFYNGEEKPEMELESKYYENFLGRAGSNADKQTAQKKWAEDGFAERLFEEMDPNCPLAISAIIQGRLKYREIDSALQLYNQAKQSNIKLSVGVYNALLSEALAIVKQYDKIQEFIMEKLNEMSKQNIRPNLGTLNAALKSFSRTNHVNLARNLMAEFMNLGIQPSLGSYGYLFQVFSRLKLSDSSRPAKTFVNEILDQIERQHHEIRDPSDLDFFPTAMSIFDEQFDDCELALQLHKMYLKPGNSKFVVKAKNEYIYYRHLFFIVFKKKPIDFAMDIYRRYIFTCFSPDARVVTAIIGAIHESLTPQYLVELWADFNKLGFSKNRPMLARILALIKDFTDDASLKVFHEAAINFLTKAEDMKAGDEELLPDVLLALAKNKDEKRILEVIKFIRENNINFTDFPESTAETIMDLAISNNNVPFILETLRLAEHQDLTSTAELAKKCLPLLSGSDKARANALISEQEGRRVKTKPRKDV